MDMIEFDIDTGGESLPAGTGKLPSMVQRAIDILDKLPDGKMITTRRLSELLGNSHNSVSCHSAHPALKPYKAQYKYNYNVYGNKNTIAEFMRMKNGCGEDEG